MFAELELRKIVETKIDEDEGLGEQVGGSGHLGYVSYNIEEIKHEKVQGVGWRISYAYSLIVETEFTYYPDNPPREYNYRKSPLIDKNGRLINNTE